MEVALLQARLRGHSATRPPQEGARISMTGAILVKRAENMLPKAYREWLEKQSFDPLFICNYLAAKNAKLRG